MDFSLLNYKNIKLWVIVLVLGGLVFFWVILTNKPQEELKPPDITPTVTPVNSPTPTATPKPPTSTKKPEVEKIPNPKFVFPTAVPRNLITGPATCQLSGSITFINENLYKTNGAKIVYQNVDDSSRFIFWKATPDDGALRAGPNIFDQLELPNSETSVGVSLTKSTNVKAYVLTASVTYGVIKSEGVMENKESPCTGSILVTL